MVRASVSGQAGPSKIDPINAIPKLEAASLGTPFNPNPLLPLLSYARHRDAEVVHKAIWALHRVLVQYINDERVGGIIDMGAQEREDAEAAEKEGNVKGWVRDRLLEYAEILGSLLRDTEPSLRQSGLKLLFALLGPLSSSLSSDKPIIHTPYFRLTLRALFSPGPSLRGAKTANAGKNGGFNGKWKVDESVQIEEEEGLLPPDVVEMVDEEMWAKYDDIRWAFFKESTHLLTHEPGLFSESENLLAQLLPLTNLPREQADINAFYLPSFSAPPSTTAAPGKKKAKTGSKKKKAETIDALPDWMATYESESEDDEPEVGPRKRQRTTALSVHASVYSIASHMTVYTALWETILGRLRLNDVQTRRVLVGLHGEKGILGHMRADKRVRVADWLGSLVDAGGAKAMLAMNGLFVLMTKYNLEYSEFYRRLYGLLDANVLHVKYRARFFRLLDTFLASPLLPAAIIASFIKRLSRLSLTAPPAGIIIAIPFIYNLFKRHPGCMVMIQRPSSEAATDPYDPEDPSPLTTGAIGSSCWELASLQKHYLGSVATMARVFTEVFTKPEYNMEDFLDHGYDTLFATEVNRKIKNPPALNIALESGEGTDPFPRTLGEDVEGDEVSNLWAF